jgi:hypothetical protein
MLKNKLIGFLLMLLTALPAAAQNVNWIDDARLTVDEMKVVFLSDINFLDTRDVPIYLQITGEVRMAPGDDPATTRYVLELGLTYNGEMVIVQKSRPFTLDEIGLKEGDPISFTNLVFVDGRISPRQTNLLSWGPTETHIPEGMDENALLSGMLPAGTYLMYGTFYHEGQPDGPEKSIELTITGLPSFLDLIYPGIDFGSDDVPIIYQPNPVFQWRAGSPDDFKFFEFKLYLKEPFHKSINDVLQSDPYAVIKDIDGNLFSYPYPADAKPLQQGRTYVWFVEGIVPTSSGPDAVRIKSPYYVFTYQQPGSGISSFGSIEHILKQIFGGSIPDEIVEQLKGVSFNGMIRVNGRQVSPTDLGRMVNVLAKKASEEGNTISDYIKNVRVEEK